MKKKVLSLAIITLLFVTGCGNPKLENGEEIIAKIDDLEISVNDVYEKLKASYGAGVTIDMVDSFIANALVKTDDAANKYVNDQIEAYEAQYENFEELVVQSGYKDVEDFKSVLLASYKKSKVVEDYYMGQLTDEDIEKHYNEEVSNKMDVRHILITPEEKADEKEQEAANKVALDAAIALIKELDGGAKFEDLAKEHSDDTASATEGGLIKDVQKSGFVSEFFEASLKLKNNEYTKEPVQSRFGYHIILKLSETEKDTLENMKEEIKKTLVTNIISADEGASDKAWVEIRKEHNFEIFDKDIKVTYNNSVTTIKEGNK